MGINIEAGKSYKDGDSDKMDCVWANETYALCLHGDQPILYSLNGECQDGACPNLTSEWSLIHPDAKEAIKQGVKDGTPMKFEIMLEGKEGEEQAQELKNLVDPMGVCSTNHKYYAAYYPGASKLSWHGLDFHEKAKATLIDLTTGVVTPHVEIPADFTRWDGESWPAGEQDRIEAFFQSGGGTTFIKYGFEENYNPVNTSRPIAYRVIEEPVTQKLVNDVAESCKEDLIVRPAITKDTELTSEMEVAVNDEYRTFKAIGPRWVGRKICELTLPYAAIFRYLNDPESEVTIEAEEKEMPLKECSWVSGGKCPANRLLIEVNQPLPVGGITNVIVEQPEAEEKPNGYEDHEIEWPLAGFRVDGEFFPLSGAVDFESFQGYIYEGETTPRVESVLYKFGRNLHRKMPKGGHVVRPIAVRMGRGE